MKVKLLELLVCPKCHQSLNCLNPVYEDDEVKSGVLICPTNHSFEISDFIPVFTNEIKYVEAFDFISKNRWCKSNSPEDHEMVLGWTMHEFKKRSDLNPMN